MVIYFMILVVGLYNLPRATEDLISGILSLGAMIELLTFLAVVVYRCVVQKRTVWRSFKAEVFSLIRPLPIAFIEGTAILYIFMNFMQCLTPMK